MSKQVRQQLLHARELIKAERYTDARKLLKALPDDPNAQRWLAQLDELGAGLEISEAGEPVSVDVEAIASYASAPTAAPRRSALTPEAERAVTGRRPTTAPVDPRLRLPRYLVSGAVMIVAVIMIAGFFLFPWMDLGEMSIMGMSLNDFASAFSVEGANAEIDTGPLEVTAMELWMGTNDGKDFTMDLTKPDGGGLADVRLLDRFLMLIPVLALVLMWFAWNYASGAGAPLVSVSAMAVVAVVLLALPFVWEQVSEQQVKDDAAASLQTQMSGTETQGIEGFTLDMSGLFGGMFSFKDAYSTGEQVLLSAIAFVVCLLGLVVEFMSIAQRDTRQPIGAGFE